MIQHTPKESLELDWVWWDCYQMLERIVAIRSTSLEFAHHTRRLLRSFPIAPTDRDSADVILSVRTSGSPGKAVDTSYTVFRNEREVAQTSNQWHAFHHLLRELDIYLADEVNSHYLLHSGAVAQGGQGILLPGESGSGKSSLTLALVRQGYCYLSDELSAIHLATGELHPFPRPLCIKDMTIFPDLARDPSILTTPTGGLSDLITFLQPEDIPNVLVGDPVPVRFIIFPQYHPDASPSLTPLTAGETVERLLAQSGNFPRLRGKGLDVLAGLVEGAKRFSLVSNNLDSATTMVGEVTNDI